MIGLAGWLILIDWLVSHVVVVVAVVVVVVVSAVAAAVV